MKNFNLRIPMVLIFIMLIALLLRTYKLSEIPASLNPDEVSLGYTAYSFFKTGADEHGKFLPLSLQSFGDWKMPVYSYVTIIPVAILGLNEVAVRLPSALAGVIGVILIYFISLLLFKKKTTAFFAACFFAFSPWNFYFSRAAYEVNLATNIFLTALLFILKYVQQYPKNGKLLLFASVLFGLTMFTHHAYIFFTPLFVLTSIFIFRKNIDWGKRIFLAIGLFSFFVLIAYNSSVIGGNKKISTLLIFNDKSVLYNRVEKLRGDKSFKNLLFERIIHNKYIAIPYQFSQNYLSSFSPSFLFDKGGEKLVHNLGGFGNLYLFDALLIFVGFAGLFWRKEKALKFLLLWLFIAPISSALTRDTPNSTRLFPMMPLFVLITSYGADQIRLLLGKKSMQNYLAKGLLIALFSLNVILFLEEYFVHLNTQRIRFWHYGYREAVKLTLKYPEYKVVMRGPENFPYIYFLFYEKYDPLRFRKEAQYYPPTSEGFYYVKSFGRYHFVELIDYTKLEPKTIYIDDTRLDDKDRSIFLPSGEPILGYHIEGEK